jgi:uncharacterized protein YwqG
MNLKNSIEIITEENYDQVGNSRIGGCPDLPRSTKYPMSESGFYEFILQVNLANDNIVGLPTEGLLSIFYGNLDKNEGIGIYTLDISNLEKKEIPVESKFSGVTDYYPSKPHKIKIKSKGIQPREDLPEYNDSSFTEEENIWHWKTDFIRNNSYFFNEGVDDKNSLYLRTNDFYLMAYGFGMRIDEKNNEIIYSGQNANREYNNLDDILSCEVTKFYEKMGHPEKYERKDWLDELHRFEMEKELHLKRFKEFNCFLSLESIRKTNMVWGDYNKLEFYYYESDLSKLDQFNLVSTMN